MVQEGWATFRKGSVTVRTWSENVPRWSGNSQEMVWNCKDMVWIGNESVRKMWASVRKWSKILEMAENCQEMVREWFEMIWNGLKLSEIVPWSNIVQDDPRWFIAVHYGLKWSEMVNMVWNGPRFQNGQTCLKQRTAWAPKAQRPAEKKETLDHPPHFYGSIFFLCSFLFEMFKSFHIAR